ncbi:CopG family transcriptional regulator [Caenimonas terrae]|uniref:CopG family transcriptional regulator n=1 Tax=Caenimonas terrae TaxID=696074 RepID=A0ABW0NFL4_9BURK
MEPKTARITVLIDPGKKLALEKLCAEQDVTPSQVVRRLIRDYLVDNGIAVAKAPSEQPQQRT